MSASAACGFAAMLKTVKIKNFRSFRQFELHDLGRINLLVGANNSGKTSVLEAIHLLRAQGNPRAFIDLMKSRGEYMSGESKSNREWNIRHLFHGHSFDVGSEFSVTGATQKSKHLEHLTVSVSTHDPIRHTFREDLSRRLEIENEDRLGLFEAYDLKVDWSFGKEHNSWGNLVSLQGGLSSPTPAMPPRPVRASQASPSNNLKVEFLTCAGLSVAQVVKWFDQIVLTPEEENVYEALRTIEPNIKRIATINNNKISEGISAQKGFAVLIDDYRVPIGSMGDGIWRMLGLVLASIQVSNGCLLVDEIDTGLHFTAMTDMWKLIWEIAKRLNVQVFATTHSSDCWKSLAAVARKYDTSDDGITIQRIERNQSKGVVFSGEETFLASDMGIEVR
ncbi:MAG: ATP/GTP-binding protein [Leptolyngbyaceae cyanobacterium]